MSDIDQVDAMLEASLQEAEKEREEIERDKKRRRSRSRSHSRSRHRSRSRDRSRHRRRSSRSRHSRSRSPRRRRSRSPRGRRSRSPRNSRRRQRTPSPDLTEEERDARTVVCLQLNRKCTERDLREFLEEHVGKVRRVKMISDRNSRRPKGIAYAEFRKLDSIPKAIQLTGTRLMGAPIVVMVTQAEKNRLAAEKNRQEQVTSTKLAVMNLPPAITQEKHLKLLFESFGRIKECIIAKNDKGETLNQGVVVFDNPKAAQNALEAMNGREVMGFLLRVSLAANAGMLGLVSSDLSETLLDREETDKTGVVMSAAARATLMQKLAASRGIAGPNQVNSAPATSNVPIASISSTSSGGISMVPTSQMVLKNMFDSDKETAPNWEQELREDVLKEVSKIGPVYHIKVDAMDDVIYVKFKDAGTCSRAQTALQGRIFDGRSVQAQFMSEASYNKRCPEASHARRPIHN